MTSQLKMPRDKSGLHSNAFQALKIWLLYICRTGTMYRWMLKTQETKCTCVSQVMLKPNDDTIHAFLH